MTGRLIRYRPADNLPARVEAVRTLETEVRREQALLDVLRRARADSREQLQALARIVDHCTAVVDLVDEMRAAGELRTQDDGASKAAQPGRPSLEDLGLDHRRVAEWRQLRDHDAAAYLEQLGDDELGQASIRWLAAQLNGDADLGVHVVNNSGDCEWYTPARIIAAARRAMGGIDLDPASSDQANEHVGADAYFTVAEDGLTRPWHGRVWLNPPYTFPTVERFVRKLADHYHAGDVTQGITLVNNATETPWFQDLGAAATTVCFPRSRIVFDHPTRTSVRALQGQAIVYLGRRVAAFTRAFEPIGLVLTR